MIRVSSPEVAREWPAPKASRSVVVPALPLRLQRGPGAHDAGPDDDEVARFGAPSVTP